MSVQIFGKFCLLDRISVGGMAEVFRARPFNDRGYSGFLALKRILPHLAEDPEFVKMFIDEAVITTQLHHRNIVRVHEMATFQGDNFIVMEYICGCDVLAIQKAMRRRKEICPIDYAAMIISDVASGLHYAHQLTDEYGRCLNIVHRDISPQNILVQYDGVAKVIDFGIAKTSVKSTKTRVGVVKGKVGYMSPEQVRSEPLTGQSDVFSVGVVLWELATNKRLFKGANEFDTMNMVRETKVQPPSQLNPSLPEEIDRIILKALAGRLEDRYASGAELAADLDQFLLNRPTSRSRFARWLQQIFESDVEEERERIQRYKNIQTPNDVIEYNRELEAKETKLKTVPEVPAIVRDQVGSMPSKGGSITEEDPIDVPPTEHDAYSPDMGDDLISEPSSALEPVEHVGMDIGIGDIPFDQPIDNAAYLAFADERTQIRAGGFSLDDIADENGQPENPFVASFGFGPEPAKSPKESGEASGEVKKQEEQSSLPSFKVMFIGFLALLLTGIGVAVAAAMLLKSNAPGEAVSASSNASLVINVSPPQGIDVSLDGLSVGHLAPITIGTVASGEHRLVIQAKGYKPYQEILQIPNAGIIDRTISLVPLKDNRGMIFVDASKLDPAAKIYVDGDKRSRNSVEEGIRVVPGQHLVEVTENGKSAYSDLFELKPGEVKKINPVLHSFNRRIIFPEGYEVEINGESVDGNKYVFDSLKPQMVTLKKGGSVAWSGYVGYPELAIENFDMNKTPANLTPKDFGWLSVNTKKDWWMIALDSVDTGLSSPISVENPLPVRKGKYHMKLYRAGAKVDVPVDIPAGGSVYFDRDIALNTEVEEVEKEGNGVGHTLNKGEATGESGSGAH